MARRALTLKIESARDLAVNALLAFDTDDRDIEASLDEAFREAAWSDPDRRLATELAYGVCRRLITLDHLIGCYSTRPLRRIEHAVKEILRVGLYQMVCLSRTPDFAAVHEAVEQAKRTGLRGAHGFVNAVLRAAQADMAGHVDGPVTLARNVLWLDEQRGVTFRSNVFPHPTRQQIKYYRAAFGYPMWLIERWLRQFGAKGLIPLMLAGNGRPMLSLRVNPLRCTREQLLEALQQAGVGAKAWGQSVTLTERMPVEKLVGYDQGWFSVQDVTATEAASLLAAQPGERVLDLCAAPGGKTMCLAGAMENHGTIVACDVITEKLTLIERNCRRLGMSIVRTSLADEVGKAAEHQGPFDAALVDVPCSNSGVLARRVEARHRLKPVHVHTLRARQAELLERAARLLKPAGRLVYSTCSVEAAENEQIVEAFLARHGDFAQVKAQHWLPGERSLKGSTAELSQQTNDAQPATGEIGPLWRDGGYASLLQRKPKT